jgi:hypothetical protein
MLLLQLAVLSLANLTYAFNLQNLFQMTAKYSWALGFLFLGLVGFAGYSAFPRVLYFLYSAQPTFAQQYLGAFYKYPESTYWKEYWEPFWCPMVRRGWSVPEQAKIDRLNEVICSDDQ